MNLFSKKKKSTLISSALLCTLSLLLGACNSTDSTGGGTGSAPGTGNSTGSATGTGTGTGNSTGNSTGSATGTSTGTGSFPNNGGGGEPVFERITDSATGTGNNTASDTHNLTGGNPPLGTGSATGTGNSTGNNTDSATGTSTGTGSFPNNGGGGESVFERITDPRGATLFEAPPNPEAIRAFTEASQIRAVSQNQFNLGTLRSIDFQPNDNIPLRNPHNQVPNTPVIHQYHYPAASVPLVVSFPPEFIHQLPVALQNTLRTQHIDHLDLFFAPQHAIPGQTLPNLDNTADQDALDHETLLLLRAAPYLCNQYNLHFAEGSDPIVVYPPDFSLTTTLDQSDLADLRQIATDTLLHDPAMQEGVRATHQPGCLKPAFWVDPDMPYIDNILGHRWSHNVHMALFEPNDPNIHNAVRIAQLHPFSTVPHDGLISNDVGQLNLQANRSYSFWSLSVSPTLARNPHPQAGRNSQAGPTFLSHPQQKKAAATLHWLLPDRAYEYFVTHLQASRSLAGQNLHQLVQALERDHLFAAPENRHMIDTLRRFLYPQTPAPENSLLDPVHEVPVHEVPVHEDLAHEDHETSAPPTDTEVDEVEVVAPQPPTVPVTQGPRVPVVVDLAAIDPTSVTPLIRFYAGVGVDHAGRTLANLWNLGADPTGGLEAQHDYIQWLFPLPEATAHNASAPLLTEAEIAIIRNSEGLRANIRTSLEVMSEFYHFTVTPHTDTHPMTITPRTDFFTHHPHWLTPGNHNYLRMSRILRSLFLVGMNEERTAFMSVLEMVYANLNNPDRIIQARTLHVWRARYTGDNNSNPGRRECPLPGGVPSLNSAPTATE